MARTAILALVALLHLGLFALLQGVPWPRVRVVHATAGDAAIRIRFITLPAKSPPGISARTRQGTASKLIPVTVVRRPVVPDKAPAEVRPQRSESPAVPVADYVAGGSRFDAGLRAAQQRVPVVRLPGSSRPIVSGVHMVDPRSQGVSGAVRMLAGLFGATDPHCVAVDSWRSLTTQEMLDRHISPDEVDRMAEEYRCKPR
ncbi:MAG: hypothetical protein WBG81_02955 [Rhodanobacter sp.]|jgi:hypothetical protein|uniref:hypothetical protein n=1 Tax=Rhodanobacter sp. KK11 TaxID=3083255 RepID=UPI0029670884|nr:hypothetical protein [Rhodanobacter sp. KK11]MDW2981300.1 hypothetical protein [Rhodanobacter sp. KK11]